MFYISTYSIMLHIELTKGPLCSIYMFSIAHTQSCYILSLLKVHYVLYVFYSPLHTIAHTQSCYILSLLKVYVLYVFYSTQSCYILSLLKVHYVFLYELTKGPLCFSIAHTQLKVIMLFSICYILSLLKHILNHVTY